MALEIQVATRLDPATVRTLKAEAEIAISNNGGSPFGEPPLSLSDVVRHVLRTHASEVERWLAGEGPRPTTMLPRGDFDDYLEQRAEERQEYWVRERAKRERAKRERAKRKKVKV